MERMMTIFRNAIKENLVSRVRYYPGLHCHHELVDRRTLRGVWENWTATRQTGQTTVERHTLRCARLPFLADLTEHEHRKVMTRLSNEVHEELDPKRKVLGQAKILGAHPHSTPGNPTDHRQEQTSLDQFLLCRQRKSGLQEHAKARLTTPEDGKRTGDPEHAPRVAAHVCGRLSNRQNSL